MSHYSSAGNYAGPKSRQWNVGQLLIESVNLYREGPQSQHGVPGIDINSSLPPGGASHQRVGDQDGIGWEDWDTRRRTGEERYPDPGRFRPSPSQSFSASHHTTPTSSFTEHATSRVLPELPTQAAMSPMDWPNRHGQNYSYESQHDASWATEAQDSRRLDDPTNRLLGLVCYSIMRAFDEIQSKQQSTYRELANFQDLEAVQGIWSEFEAQCASIELAHGERDPTDNTTSWDDIANARFSGTDELETILNGILGTLVCVKLGLDGFFRSLQHRLSGMNQRQLRKRLRMLGARVSKGRRVTKNVPTDGNSAQTVLKRQLKEQLDALESGLREISKEIANVTSLCSQLSDLLQRGDEDYQVVRVLDRFQTTRVVSTSLHQQLRQICPQHREHRVYFNLATAHGPMDNDVVTSSIDFHLAVERCNTSTASHGGGGGDITAGGRSSRWIWLCAQTSILEETVDDPAAYSVLTSTPHGKLGISRRHRSDFGTSRPSIKPTTSKESLESVSRHPCNLSGPQMSKSPGNGHARTIRKVHKRPGLAKRPNADRKRRATLARKLSQPQCLRDLYEANVEVTTPSAAGGGRNGYYGWCLENLFEGAAGEFVADLSSLMRQHQQQGSESDIVGGTKTVTSRLTYSALLSTQTPPMPLSQWMLNIKPVTPTLRVLSCIRVAKAIVKSVLGFSPSLWPQQRPLATSDVMILGRQGSGAEWTEPEPLLHVRLTKVDRLETSSGSASVSNLSENTDQEPEREPQQQGNQQQHPEMLLRLGIILLELAFLQPLMPSLRETAMGRVDREDIAFRNLKRRYNKVKYLFTDPYADAVQYCIEFEGSGDDLFANEIHQQQFYDKVVRGLEKAEEAAVQSMQRTEMPRREQQSQYLQVRPAPSAAGSRSSSVASGR